MADTETPPTEGGVPATAPDRNVWRRLAVVGALVAVAAVGVAVFAVTRDDGAGVTANDLAATRHAQQLCQQWFDDGAGSTSAVAPGWCSHMGDRMYDQMASGRMGSMMWGSPSGMYDTCISAMGSFQGRVDDAAAWCESMVDWMRDRVGDDWRGSMMNPPMMGR